MVFWREDRDRKGHLLAALATYTGKRNSGQKSARVRNVATRQLDANHQARVGDSKRPLHNDPVSQPFVVSKNWQAAQLYALSKRSLSPFLALECLEPLAPSAVELRAPCVYGCMDSSLFLSLALHSTAVHTPDSCSRRKAICCCDPLNSSASGQSSSWYPAFHSAGAIWS